MCMFNWLPLLTFANNMQGIFIQCNGKAFVMECIRTVSRWTLMLIVMKWSEFRPPPSLEEEKLI